MSSMHEIQVTSSSQVTLVLIAEAYLGFRTLLNSYDDGAILQKCQWLKAMNYFRKKAPS